MKLPFRNCKPAGEKGTGQTAVSKAFILFDNDFARPDSADLE